MKLDEFLRGIYNFIEEHPDALNKEVVVSSDAEGNSYNPVYYTPSLGRWFSEDKGFMFEHEEPNAICIN